MKRNFPQGGRLTLLIAVAATAVITALAAPAWARPLPILKGEVSSNSELDELAAIGVKAAYQSSPKYLVVDSVRMGSVGFYNGVEKGDRVAFIERTPTELTIDLIRGPHSYRINLLTRANKLVLLESAKADAYLLRLQSSISDRQAARGKQVALEKQLADKTIDSDASKQDNTSPAKLGSFVTSATDVFDGRTSVKQGYEPNCWFEASLSAVANSPRGPQMIANLIKKTGERTYRVTFAEQAFPGDCKWVDVNVDELDARHLHDQTLWARILDCACVKKYPEPVDGTSGLRILTGKEILTISPGNAGIAADTIQRIVVNKFPAIMGTRPNCTASSLRAQHAFTIVGYDKKLGIATLRDPVGSKIIYYNRPKFENAEAMAEEFRRSSIARRRFNSSQFESHCRQFQWRSLDRKMKLLIAIFASFASALFIACCVNAANADDCSLAKRYIGVSDFQKAGEVCKQIIAKNPNNADAHYLLGSILYRWNRKKESRVEFTLAAKLDPKGQAGQYSLRYIKILDSSKTEDDGNIIDAAAKLNKLPSGKINNEMLSEDQRLSDECDAQVKLIQTETDKDVKANVDAMQRSLIPRPQYYFRGADPEIQNQAIKAECERNVSWLRALADRRIADIKALYRAKQTAIEDSARTLHQAYESKNQQGAIQLSPVGTRMHVRDYQTQSP